MFAKNVLSFVSLTLMFASSLHGGKVVKSKDDCMDIVYGTPSFVVSRQCSKGIIKWKNSTEHMDMVFEPEGLNSFTVCVAWYKGAVCEKLLDQSLGTEGLDIAPDEPMDGTPICLESVGQVKISCVYSEEPTALLYTYSVAQAK